MLWSWDNVFIIAKLGTMKNDVGITTIVHNKGRNNITDAQCHLFYHQEQYFRDYQ